MKLFGILTSATVSAIVGVAMTPVSAQTESEDDPLAELTELLPIGRPVQKLRVPQTRSGGDVTIIEADTLTKTGPDRLAFTGLSFYRESADRESPSAIQFPSAEYQLDERLFYSPYPVDIAQPHKGRLLGEGMIYDVGNEILVVLGQCKTLFDKQDSVNSKPASQPDLWAPHSSDNAALVLDLTPEELSQHVSGAQTALAAADRSFAREQNARILSYAEEAREREFSAALAAFLEYLAANQTVVPVQNPAPTDKVLTDEPKAATRPDTVAKGTLTSKGGGVVDHKKKVSVFKDDVVMRLEEFTIHCDLLQVAYDDDNAEPKEAIATGDMVVITRINADGETEEARCRKAVYANEKLVLTGRPQVQKGNVVTLCDKIIIPKKGKITFDGATSIKRVGPRKPKTNN